MAERQITLEDLIFMTSQSDWLYYSYNQTADKYASYDTSLIEYMYDMPDYPYVYTQEEGSNTLYRFFGTPTIEDVSNFLSNHYNNHSKVFIENTLYDCMPIFRSQYPYIINKLFESDITISSVNSVNDKYILYVIFRTSKRSSMGGGSDLYTYQNVSRSQSSTQDQFAYYYGEFNNLLNVLKQTTDKIVYFEFGYIFNNQFTENNISILQITDIKNVLTKLDLSIANSNIYIQSGQYIFMDNSTNYEDKQTYNISDIKTLKPTFSFDISSNFEYVKLGWCTMTNMPNPSCGLDINGQLDQYKYGKDIFSGVNDTNSLFYDFNNSRIFRTSFKNAVLFDGPNDQNYQKYLFPYIEQYSPSTNTYVFNLPAIKNAVSDTNAYTLYSPILNNIDICDFVGDVEDKRQTTVYDFKIVTYQTINDIDISVYSTYNIFRQISSQSISPNIDCLLVADIFLTPQQFQDITKIYVNNYNDYNWQTYDLTPNGQQWEFLYKKYPKTGFLDPSNYLIGQHKPIVLGLIKNFPFEAYISYQSNNSYKITNLQLKSINCQTSPISYVSNCGYFIDLLFDFNDNNCLEKKLLNYYYDNISKYIINSQHNSYKSYVENTRFLLLPNIQQIIKSVDIQIDSTINTQSNAKINAYTEIKNIDNLGHTI